MERLETRLAIVPGKAVMSALNEYLHRINGGFP